MQTSKEVKPTKHVAKAKVPKKSGATESKVSKTKRPQFTPKKSKPLITKKRARTLFPKDSPSTSKTPTKSKPKKSLPGPKERSTPSKSPFKIDVSTKDSF